MFMPIRSEKERGILILSLIHIFSTANCDFTDPLALHAIKMIQRDLVGSYNGDMEKRDSIKEEPRNSCATIGLLPSTMRL